MFRNYLIVALRNLTRHKLYSFINIAGLTVGLTCAIFIILFVRDQLSYDRWIPGTENLYRVEVTFNLSRQAARAGCADRLSRPPRRCWTRFRRSRPEPG